MDRKIVGNPVGIPNPITDLAQTDPTKADYVKNKKLSYMEDDVGYATEKYVDEESSKGVAESKRYTDSRCDDIDSLLQTKADKTAHHEYREDVWDYAEYDFYNENNVESRFKILQRLSIVISSGEYFLGYISGLSFDSGETPTAIDYSGSGILNWVGTDCTTSDGYSIFQPSANTHYDIVFYFNGTQFIGLVNGFVPASGNVVSG